MVRASDFPVTHTVLLDAQRAHLFDAGTGARLAA